MNVYILAGSGWKYERMSRVPYLVKSGGFGERIDFTGSHLAPISAIQHNVGCEILIITWYTFRIKCIQHGLMVWSPRNFWYILGWCKSLRGQTFAHSQWVHIRVYATKMLSIQMSEKQNLASQSFSYLIDFWWMKLAV